MNADSDVCPICLCPKRRIVSIRCKHTFCKNCLKDYYAISDVKTCPMCRAPFEYYIRESFGSIRIVFLN
ncbi:E3 ubiquitin ligase TRIM40 [Drosophila nasuta]|uniref:E3 ubiquitin ligase TRIM40 n=1 Tax=Drosophila nasuta TaxID=42062 RepID=UPI00295E978E|nr:E3 ubiquitin ligase TRIM40 [Drosophila nasuta]